ncbi:hypothetical protein LX87_01832 [Larkinella arboricola]|uniref:Uncharacterized protein n=1 Tax=Larkinella arboricola TaxID=643671 RepID=A0A327X476_LARAB|nr:hypothetical protein LX87_01832 [Larkinella arboricola]
MRASICVEPALLVHPDFLRNYPLDTKIKNYGFFSYSVTESLHLPDKEKTIITSIVKNIGEELETAIDDISQSDLLLHHYFNDERALMNGLPTVPYLVQQIFSSRKPVCLRWNSERVLINAIETNGLPYSR